MTREEKLHWLNVEIQTWENDCQSKHPIKEALYAARKALEQEPCEDAVSRKSVIAIIQNHWWNCRDIDKLVNELPSVTPQEPSWIPMIRREPTNEEKAEYLAQNGEELCYMLENEMPLNGQEVLVSIGEFVSEDIFDEDFYNFENNDVENVVAWMPLPEPYTGGEDAGGR